MQVATIVSQSVCKTMAEDYKTDSSLFLFTFFSFSDTNEVGEQLNFLK